MSTNADDAVHRMVADYNAKTDAAVQMRPALGEVRTALMGLEHSANATGWDGPDAYPRIFAVERNRKTHAITTRWAENWNPVLPRLMDFTDSNLGKSLTMIAEQAEGMRIAATGGPIEDWLSGDLPALMALGNMRERAQRGLDLHKAMARGAELFGYGVRFEGWGMVDVDMTTPEGVDLFRAWRERRLHARPERIETRSVHAVTRDNRQWMVMRYRGFRPLSRVWDIGEPDQFVGGIPNALSRILAALVNNQVATVPVDLPADQDPLRS